MRGLQQPLFAPQTEWVPPSEFKDLSNLSLFIENCIFTVQVKDF